MAEELRLNPRVTYALSVADKRTPEKSFPALNISLLSDEEAETIRTIEKEIRGLDLPDIEKQIRVAELYATWGINIEALNILENSLVNSGNQQTNTPPADILLTLADLYRSIGMTNLAITNYVKAYEIAKAENNLSQQGYALEGFGLVLAIEGKNEQAKRKFFGAVTTFERAGNAEMVLRLNQRLQSKPLFQ
jgi:tetratricopeptide (TPR) repeat protein